MNNRAGALIEKLFGTSDVWVQGGDYVRCGGGWAVLYNRVLTSTGVKMARVVRRAGWRQRRRGVALVA